jgi:hypothetical protein
MILLPACYAAAHTTLKAIRSFARAGERMPGSEVSKGVLPGNQRVKVMPPSAHLLNGNAGGFSHY